MEEKRYQNKRFPKIMVVFFLYFGLALFSLRKIFLTPGIVGHNWDWSVPALPEYLRHMFSDSFYLWWDLSLGQPSYFRLNLIPLHILMTIWGFWKISGEWVSKMMPFLAILMACFFMYLLAREILFGFARRGEISFVADQAALLSGLFYGFSPFIFQDILGGANSEYLCYGLLPLAFLSFLKKRFFLTVFLFSFLACSIHLFILASILIVIYVLVNDFARIKQLVELYFAIFLLNLYWIVPFLYPLLRRENLFSAEEGRLWLEAIKFGVPSLREIFIATGYFRPLFTMSILPEWKLPWEIFSFLFVVIVVYGANLFLGGKRRPFFWLVFLIFSFIPATGGRSPFGGFVLWVYEHFPLMNLFRSPQHFLIWPTFCFAILIATGSYFLLEQFASSRKKVLVLSLSLAIGIIFWVHPFFLYGDLGRAELSRRFAGGNYLDIFQLAPDYQYALQYLADQKDNFRILVLPMTASPYYLATKYQMEAQGGDPHVFRSPHSVVVANFVPDGPALWYLEKAEKEIYQAEDWHFFLNFLNQSGVRYVLLRKDIVPASGKNMIFWDFSRVKKFLDGDLRLEKIFEGETIVLYRLKDEVFTSRILAIENILQSSGYKGDEILINKLTDFSATTSAYLSEYRPEIKSSGTIIPLAVVRSYSQRKEGIPEVFYPYVTVKPEKIWYPLIEFKEMIAEKMEDNPERLYHRKLFYASKRINEIIKWHSELSPESLEETARRYHQKMIEALAILETIRQQTEGEKPEADFWMLLSKFRVYLKDHRAKFDQIFPETEGNAIREKMSDLAFGNLEILLENVGGDPGNADILYRFYVHKAGWYQIDLQNDDLSLNGQFPDIKISYRIDEGSLREIKYFENKDWVSLDRVFLGSGPHHLYLYLFSDENLVHKDHWRDYRDWLTNKINRSEISLSLLTEEKILDSPKVIGQEIGHYKGGDNYRIFLEYQSPAAKIAVIVEEKHLTDKGERQKIVMNYLLPKTKERTFSQEEIIFNSSLGAIGASIYLVVIPEGGDLSDVLFRDVRVGRALEPRIIAYSTPLSGEQVPSGIKITSERINQAKYHIKIANADQPYLLVFSESFSPDWRLYSEDLGREVAGDRHLPVNVFANGWYILPEDFDNRSEYNLVLEFWPQRLPLLGLGCSGLFLGIILIIALWRRSKGIFS